MKETLLGIQAQLQTSLSYMRKGDIFLTGYTELPPADAMLPAIGITDGQVIKIDLAGGMIRYIMQAHIIIWTGVLNEREVLTGNSSTKGILDIEFDINVALDENKLGIAEMKSALPVSPVAKSTPVTDGKRDMQRKEFIYEYTKETARPSSART